jgi:hypothetical protein
LKELHDKNKLLAKAIDPAICAGPSPNEFTLNVNTLSGLSFDINVFEDELLSSVKDKLEEVSGLRTDLMQLLLEGGETPLEDNTPCPRVPTLLVVMLSGKYDHLMDIEIAPGDYVFEFWAYWCQEFEYASLTLAQAAFWSERCREDCIPTVFSDAADIMENWDEDSHGVAPKEGEPEYIESLDSDDCEQVCY